MKFINLLLSLVIISITGCASYVKTYDSSGTMKGIPANRPTLVKITKVTSYEVKKPDGKEIYCKDTVNEEYDIMSLGEPYYIEFDPASLAKGSFKVTFSDKGLLSSIELNSDPGVTENIGKINELVGTVLPYAVAKKAIAGAALTSEESKSTADELRAQNCLTKSVKIKEIEKIEIKIDKQTEIPKIK
jgi:hypothetical protein